MVRRYSFLVIFAAMLTVLAWGAGRLDLSAQNDSAQAGAQAGASDAPLERVELIETLDRLVAYEHYYRSVYGHFTLMLSHLGYPVPPALRESYEIRVDEASRDRLVIRAFSESDGQVRDRVTVDQDYTVHANFPVPAPRAAFLQSLALRQLRMMQGAVSGHALEEKGIFRDYFRFEIEQDAHHRKFGSAVGVRPPVVGVRLQIGAEGEVAELPEAELAHTGQREVTGNGMSTLEEAYLAQRIFHGEVGRYARNWSELSRIAAFRFEDKAQFGQEGQVPFGDGESARELRMPSSEGEPLDLEPLEIEAVSSDSN